MSFRHLTMYVLIFLHDGYFLTCVSLSLATSPTWSDGQRLDCVRSSGVLPVNSTA
jgi:hypothetical protein